MLNALSEDRRLVSHFGNETFDQFCLTDASFPGDPNHLSFAALCTEPGRSQPCERLFASYESLGANSMRLDSRVDSDFGIGPTGFVEIRIDDIGSRDAPRTDESIAAPGGG